MFMLYRLYLQLAPSYVGRIIKILIPRHHTLP
uniref:Uncharacterized protein n=1 Tax=Arundo donax TaxID=35708 RepID=A0A0A9GFK3_ARUDO